MLLAECGIEIGSRQAQQAVGLCSSETVKNSPCVYL
jgi:hypothetical protein